MTKPCLTGSRFACMDSAFRRVLGDDSRRTQRARPDDILDGLRPCKILIQRSRDED
jgi:hypothetical protein